MKWRLAEDEAYHYTLSVRADPPTGNEFDDMTGEVSLVCLAGHPCQLSQTLHPEGQLSTTVHGRWTLGPDGTADVSSLEDAPPATTRPQPWLFLRPSRPFTGVGHQLREKTAILLEDTVVEADVRYELKGRSRCGEVECLEYTTSFDLTDEAAGPGAGGGPYLEVHAAVTFAPALGRFVEVQQRARLVVPASPDQERTRHEHLRFSRFENLRAPTPALRQAVQALREAGAELRMNETGEVLGVTFPFGEATDAALVHVGQLQQLQHLSIGGQNVTDAGIAHLGGLTSLTFVVLNSARLTDAGLAMLARNPRLEFLDLTATPITDAGLRHLHGLRNLRSVAVNGTGVTGRAVAALRQARPGMAVVWSDPAAEAR